MGGMESDGASGDIEEQYRTCSACGRDCEPVPFETEEGMRISFICPLHGIHTVVDPFEEAR